MAQVFSQKKADALGSLITYAAKAEAMSRDLVELQSYFTDNGFLTGGANAIVDGDCINNAQHLTAAIVNSAVTAIATMKLSAGNTTALRQVASVPLPPST